MENKQEKSQEDMVKEAVEEAKSLQLRLNLKKLKRKRQKKLPKKQEAETPKRMQKENWQKLFSKRKIKGREDRRTDR